MKLIIILTGLCLMNLICSSQIKETVDSKNGFLEFKFGKSSKDFQGKIQKVDALIANNNSTKYQVIAPEYKKVFGYEVSEIYLLFFKDKLYAIDIEFVDEDESNAYPYIKGKLQTLFGKETGNLKREESNELKLIDGIIWVGNMNTLYLHDFYTLSTGKYYTAIYYKDQVLQDEMTQQEF